MYARFGDSVIGVPGAELPVAAGTIGFAEPSRAPPRTHDAIRNFSSAVRMRREEPRYAGESAPGIHGGMAPFAVMRRIDAAHAFASSGDVIENGATPPVRWQLAHFAAKTGATSSHVGVTAARLPPPPRARTAASTAATATVARSAAPFTPRAYRAYSAAMRAEVSLEIARSPDEVFAYLTDVSKLPSWQSGVHAARRDGSRIHESRHMLGRELHTTLEIEEEEAPRLFTIRTIDSPVPFTVRHELAQNGSGTLLTVVGEGDAGMLPGFAAGIMARRAEKQFRKDFERLKRLLES